MDLTNQSRSEVETFQEDTRLFGRGHWTPAFVKSLGQVRVRKNGIEKRLETLHTEEITECSLFPEGV